MTIPANPTVYIDWDDGDADEGEGISVADFEQLATNQRYFASLLALESSAWRRGTDVHEHFDRPGDLATILTRDYPHISLISGAPVITAGEHFVVLASGYALQTRASRRADRVPSIVEARVKMSSSSAGPILVGFAGGGATSIVNILINGTSVAFQRGTAASTYKALTVVSGVTQETTDNIAGNYTGWDILRVQFEVAQALFYVNANLMATHTIALPVTKDCAATALCQTTGNLSLDRISLAAISNSESP